MSTLRFFAHSTTIRGQDMSRKSVLHGLVNSREEEKEYTLEKIFESREINQSK